MLKWQRVYARTDREEARREPDGRQRGDPAHARSSGSACGTSARRSRTSRRSRIGSTPRKRADEYLLFDPEREDDPPPRRARRHGASARCRARSTRSACSRSCTTSSATTSRCASCCSTRRTSTSCVYHVTQWICSDSKQAPHARAAGRCGRRLLPRVLPAVGVLARELDREAHRRRSATAPTRARRPRRVIGEDVAILAPAQNAVAS